MIRELFLPDSLFTQQIIGLEIGKYTVCGTQVMQKGKLTTIQKIATISIDGSSEKKYEEQLVAALKQLLSQLHGEQVRITLPNNQVFFKEVTVPFLDPHKVKMVLGYEIESSLPFPLHEAAFDFIITKQDRVKKESTILVAIAQKNLISNMIEIFQQTESKLKISAITVDLIGFTSLYNLLQAAGNNQYQILLDLGKTSITIAYLSNGQPLWVRNLPYGIGTIISKIMHDEQKTYSEIVEILFRFGLNEDNGYNFKAAFTKFSEDLVFTINSFKTKLPPETQLNQILVIQSAVEIKNITNYLISKTDMQCDALELNKVSLHHTLGFAQQTSIHPSSLPAITAAIVTVENRDFNLLPISQFGNHLLRYQIITAAIITAILLSAIYGIGFIKNKALANTLTQFQKETVSELKKVFRDIENNNLNIVLDEAENKVAREKKIWFSFSNQKKYSALKYLQVLSNALDVDKLNLDIKKLIIKDNTMSLQGAVARTDDIFPLEQALISVPIFKHITAPQNTNFTIQIELKPSDGNDAA